VGDVRGIIRVPMLAERDKNTHALLQ